MNAPILAEEYLSRLIYLKKEMEECQIELKLIYDKLTKYLKDGHLDYLKTDTGHLVYKQMQFIHVKGRKTFDYTADADVQQMQKQLKQLKKVAETIGTAEVKYAADSWRIKTIETNDN